MRISQQAKILRHLNEQGSISSLEAMQEYGIMRLASRISELKKMGYAIVTETVKGKNRYNEPTSYAVYRFEKE